MSILDSLRRVLGATPRERRAAADARRNGDVPARAAAPPRGRVTYNCKLCGVASTIRSVVYDHLKSAHPDVLDRNGHIHERRDDEAPRSQT